MTPNVFIQECFDDFWEPWVSDVLTGFLRVEDGYLEMPDAPGIGVDLNEQEAKKPPYGKSNFFADVHARLGEARHGGQRVSEFGRATYCWSQVLLPPEKRRWLVPGRRRGAIYALICLSTRFGC